MSTLTSGYDRTFQVKLLSNLLSDAKWFKDVVRSIYPTDFDISSCRLVFEVAQKYFERHQEVPSLAVIEMEVTQTILNPGALLYNTSVGEQEYEMLGFVLASVANMTEGTKEVTYFRGKLSEYLKHVRFGNALAEGAAFGGSAADQIASIVKINDDMNKLGGGNEIVFYSASDPVPVSVSTGAKRHATGLKHIDGMVNGGLNTRAGHLGLLAACSGVGKTTGAINFAVNGAFTGHYSLFITLENPRAMIMQRAHAMLAHVDARYLAMDMATWPAAELERMAYVNSPDFRFRDNIMVYDGSLRTHDVFEIEAAITKWKTTLTETHNIDANKCCTVYVDWLEKINPEKTPGLTKNASSDVVWQKVCEYLGEVGRRTETATWIMQQATREAIGKEILIPKHLAHSIHIFDPMDLALGLAPVFDPDAIKYENHDDDGADESKKPSCDRTMNFSFLKAREAEVQGKHRSVYQGSSLRFWRRKDDAIRADAYAKSGNMDAMYAVMATPQPNTRDTNARFNAGR